MKKFLIIMVLASAMLYGQGQTLTLEQTIKIGLENSKALKISQSKIIGGDAKVSEVTSQMLPKLSLGASYTRLSSVPPFEVNVPIFPAPIKIQDAILNNYNVKLSLQQPLFTGFRLTSLRSAAESSYEALKSDYNKDANEAALNIQNAFWNLYKAQKVLALVEENLKQLEEHLSDTKKFLDNGLATTNDYLKLEVQYANVKLMRIESANNVKVAQAALNKLLGYTITNPTEITAPDIQSGVGELKYDDLSKEAVNQREELKSTQLRINAGENALTAAKSTWYPSVFLFGDYYYNRPNQRYMPTKDEFKDTWDVGVSLNWELWNWGYNASQSTQAEQQLIQTQTAYEQIKDNIELEVYQSYLKVISENDKVDVNKISVKQAEENYRITSEKYNQQVATSTDLIDAEVSLLDAKTKLATALVDFQIAKVKLNKAVGKRIY
jgi:outer membrane protein TolC